MKSPLTPRANTRLSASINIAQWRDSLLLLLAVEAMIKLESALLAAMKASLSATESASLRSISHHIETLGQAIDAQVSIEF